MTKSSAVVVKLNRTVVAATMLAGAAAMLMAMAHPAFAQTVRTNKVQYQEGETVVVHFTGLPGNYSDWVTVVPSDAPDDFWAGYDHAKYVRGERQGSLEFEDLQPGNYQARLYFDWVRSPSREVRFQVRNRYSFSVGPATGAPTTPTGPAMGLAVTALQGGLVWTESDLLSPDDEIEVHFSGFPGNETDWIAVVPAESSDGTWGSWQYTRGATEGKVTVRWLTPGRYQARVYFDWVGTTSYEVKDRHTFFVGPMPNVRRGMASTERDQYSADDSITVFYGGLPGNSSDWISIAPAGSPDTDRSIWKYTRGKQEGLLEFSAREPGQYEVRVYYDWDGTRSHQVMHRHRFTVN